MSGTEHGWRQSLLREVGTENFLLRCWKCKFGVRYKFSELHSAKGQMLGFEISLIPLHPHTFLVKESTAEHLPLVLL